MSGAAGEHAAAAEVQRSQQATGRTASADAMDAAQAALERYGYTSQKMQENDGHAAVASFDEVIQAISDDNAAAVERVALAGALANYTLVQSKEKLGKILAALPTIFATIASVLQLPDDQAASLGCYTHGLQRIAEHLSEFLRRECSADNTGQLIDACVPHIFRTLAAARSVAMEEGEGSPASARGSTILNLLNMLPRAFAVDAAMNPVETLCAYIMGRQHVQMIQFRAADALVRLHETKPELAAGHVPSLLACLAEPGTETIASSILSESSLYVQEKEAFHEHLDAIMALEFSHVVVILQHIVSAGNAVKLVRYTPTIVDNVTNEDLAIPVLQILKQICLVEPAVLRVHMDRLFIATRHAQPTLVLYADLAATIAPLSKHMADKQFRQLCDLLTSESTPKSAQKRLLTSVTNIIFFCSGAHVAEPYLQTLENIRQANPAAVQVLEDFVTGRDAVRESFRGQTVDQEAQRMNDEVRETCLSFEDVKTYVDMHLAELRDYIAYIGRTIPLPSSLEVTSTPRSKSLGLQFVCPRSGVKHAIQTRDWSRWLKLAFALIRADKCTVHISGQDSAVPASSDVGVVQDVYDIFSSDSSDDFHNYILEPFLTLADREQMFSELKNTDLHSKFFYDSRTASWCARSAMTEEEARTIPRPPTGRSHTASEDSRTSESSSHTKGGSKSEHRSRPSTAAHRASQFVRSLSNFRLNDSRDESLDVPIEKEVEHTLPYISGVVASYKAAPQGYVTYELQLHVDEHEWTVHRRYRKFARLYNTVRNSGYELQSRMPPKRYWNNFDVRVLEERKRAFQQMVNELLSYRPLIARSRKVREFFGLPDEVTALVSPQPLRQSEALMGRDDDAESPPSTPKASIPVSKSSQFLEWLAPESDVHQDVLPILEHDDDDEFVVRPSMYDV